MPSPNRPRTFPTKSCFYAYQFLLFFSLYALALYLKGTRVFQSVFRDDLYTSFFVVGATGDYRYHYSLFVCVDQYGEVQGLRFLYSRFAGCECAISRGYGRLSSLVRFFRRFLSQYYPLFFRDRGLVLFGSMGSYVCLLSSNVRSQASRSLYVVGVVYRYVCYQCYCR